MAHTTKRASALSADDRRASILAAAVPLLRERGQAVTTKEIADAAGIAEGTVFRVFEDKQALIEAAFATFMDPTRVREQLRAIPADAPLEDKVRTIVVVLRARFKGVVGMMHALGMSGPPKHIPSNDERIRQRMITEGVTRELLAAHADELRVEPIEAVQLIRMLVFASEFPALNDGPQFTTDQLTDIILRGIARTEG